MSKNMIQEELQNLSELIRRANELINPDQSIGYLLKRDIRDRLYGEKPACFIFPICNRYGMEDPKVIQISIKMAERLMVDDRFDSGALQTMLNSLNHKNDTFVKRVPKPASQAAKKAQVTRMFNNIKKYLVLSKTGESA